MSETNEFRFNRSLKKRFHNLVEVPATIVNRVEMLEAMEEYFDASVFRIPISAEFTVYNTVTTKSGCWG